jgi:hypothetical protein
MIGTLDEFIKDNLTEMIDIYEKETRKEKDGHVIATVQFNLIRHFTKKIHEEIKYRVK